MIHVGLFQLVCAIVLVYELKKNNYIAENKQKKQHQLTY